MEAPVTNAHVHTCAEYLLPGGRPEVYDAPPGRDPGPAAEQCPCGAYAFRFYSEVTATCRVGDTDVVLHSHPFGTGDWHLIERGGLIPAAGSVAP
jgi:hypothetical protein